MICNIAQNITGSVSGQVLTIAQPVIAADSVDYLTARFSFSEDWTGADKFAFFAKAGHEDEPAEILLIDDEITADAHLNLPAGRWNVWLVGLRTEGAEVTQRITTTVAEIRVQLSGVRNAEPFPGEAGSAGEQIVAQAIAARNAAQTAAQNAGASANSAAEAAVSAAMSEDSAQESAENAENSAQTAQTAAGTATDAASYASTSASAAAGLAAAAEQSANAAAGSVTTAGQSATAAQNAQTVAEAARTAAAGSAAAAATSAREAEEAAERVSDAVDKIETADLVSKSNRAALYGTVIEDKAYTFADLDTAAIPAEIDGNAVIDGGEVKLTEIGGKSIVEGGGIVDSVVGGVKIDGKTLSLPAAQTLRSAGDAADQIRFVKQTDGTWSIEKVQNIAAADLGRLTWLGYGDACYYVALEAKILGEVGAPTNIICADYLVFPEQVSYTQATSMEKGTIASGRGASTSYLYVKADGQPTSGIVYYELAEPIVTTIAEGLREDQIAALAELGGSIEIVGNTTNAHPTLVVDIQTAIPGGSSDIPAPTAYITHTDEASINITLADNTEYAITNCASITLAYPTGRYEAFISVTFGADASLTFPAGTKYIGTVPTFAAGESWEISVKNGVVVAGKVE